jgi:hypothetical protein
VTDESALLVTVPAAEPAVARHRSRLDTSAAVGVPAHITVPSCPPYGGRVAEVIPHLTIGDGAPRAELEGAEAEVRPHLPIEAEATSVTLMTGPPPGSAPTAARWTTLATFPLA